LFSGNDGQRLLRLMSDIIAAPARDAASFRSNQEHGLLSSVCAETADENLLRDQYVAVGGQQKIGGFPGMTEIPEMSIRGRGHLVIRMVPLSPSARMSEGLKGHGRRYGRMRTENDMSCGVARSRWALAHRVLKQPV
jgi:hypothetical protein